MKRYDVYCQQSWSTGYCNNTNGNFCNSHQPEGQDSVTPLPKNTLSVIGREKYKYVPVKRIGVGTPHSAHMCHCTVAFCHCITHGQHVCPSATLQHIEVCSWKKKRSHAVQKGFPRQERERGIVSFVVASALNSSLKNLETCVFSTSVVDDFFFPSAHVHSYITFTSIQSFVTRVYITFLQRVVAWGWSTRPIQTCLFFHSLKNVKITSSSIRGKHLARPLIFSLFFMLIQWAVIHLVTLWKLTIWFSSNFPQKIASLCFMTLVDG